MAAPRPLSPGNRVGRYSIGAVVRSSASSISYRCTGEHDDPVLLEEFCPAELVERNALGLLLPLPGAGDEFEARAHHFEAVGKRLGEVHRSALPFVMELVPANNTFYLASRLEEAVSLADILRHTPFLDYEDIKRIVFPLLDALRSLHEAEVLHLGIAPEAILIRPDGTPLVVGNRFLVLPPGRPPRDEVAPALYWPPELAPGPGYPPGPPSDIYAMGAVLYHCMTGRPPPAAAERLQLVAAMNADPLVRTEEAAASRFAQSMLEAVDRALVLDPADRPASIRDWTQDFLELSPKGDVTVIRRPDELGEAPENSPSSMASTENALKRLENRYKLFRALVSGAGQSRYMGALLRQDEWGLTPRPGWNGAAFLFHVLWLFYRKMYAFGIVLAPLLLFLFAAGAWAVLDRYTIIDRYWLVSRQVDQTLLFALAGFALFMGLFGDYLYYLHLRYKAWRAGRRYPDVNSQRKWCARVGGVAPLAVAIPAVALAAGGLGGYTSLKSRQALAEMQLEEALSALNFGASKVVAHLYEANTWPASTTDVIAPHETGHYRYVGEISVIRQLVVVTFREGGEVLPEFTGKSVALFGTLNGNTVTWTCGSIDFPVNYLPENCRARLK